MSETHWKKLTNPNYLGAWDFQRDEERVLTISRVLQEEVFNATDNSKKLCIVAYFQEKSKPMILNKTNCKTISGLYNTPIIEKWSGCRVIVVVEKVKSFGKLEDGLRVKKQLPNAGYQQPVPSACYDCRNEITAFGKYTAVQIASTNHKRYGVPLCAECSNKRKSDESGADGNEADT